MSQNESLQQQLQQWIEEDNGMNASDERLLNRIKKLPAKLRSIALAAFQFNASGERTIRYTYDGHDKATLKWLAIWRPKIEKLSAADRTKIFSVLGKKIAPWIEKGWQYLKTAPYRQGHYQTPFRAPNNPELTFESRLNWLGDLASVFSSIKPDALTPVWLAEWGAHAFQYSARSLTPIFVSAMNLKGKVGDEVFETLYQTVTREHPTAIMSNFVIQSLLAANRQAGWEIIEKTLLAAQRQEGLRQSIVESIDCAHPQAFHRMLKIIVDAKLIRFSSVARSVDVWLRLLWDSASLKPLTESLTTVLEFCDSNQKHQQALKSDDAETLYRALWFIAISDVVKATTAATKFLKHKDESIRFVAVWILHQLGFDKAMHAKSKLIDDENLQVAVLAACGLDGLSADEGVLVSLTNDSDLPSDRDYFERIERLFQRLPQKPTTLKPLVWPWTERKVGRSNVCGLLLDTLGDRPPTRLLPYLQALSTWQKSQVIGFLAEQKKWDKLTRESLMSLTGNASSDVRRAAFNAVEKKKLTDSEYLKFEGYLGRTAIDLRQRVVSILLKRKDAQVLESVDRLLGADAKRRLAGLELLRQMADADRSRKACVAVAAQFRLSRRKISKAEEIQLVGVEESDRPTWTLEDGLGLMDPAGRTPVIKPKKKKIPLITKASIECIKSLDKLAHKLRDETVTCKTWRGTEDLLLGEMRYHFPDLNIKKPIAKQLKQFPLWTTWAQWNQDRAAKLQDKDGLELLRACNLCTLLDRWNFDEIKESLKSTDGKKLGKVIFGETAFPKLKYPAVVQNVLDWLVYSKLPKGGLDYLLDCKENSAAHVPDTAHKKLLEIETEKPRAYYHYGSDESDWRKQDLFEFWPASLNRLIKHTPDSKISAAQRRRIFELDQYWDEPIPGAPRQRVHITRLCDAFQKKYATKDDLVDAMIGLGGRFDSIASLTERFPDAEIKAALQNTRGLGKLVDQVREKLLEVELARGEKATVSTDAALQVQSYFGIDTFCRVQEALNGPYKVLHGWNATTANSRAATLTDLIKATYPRTDESAADFARLTKKAIADGYFSEDQMLQLAFLAPQWSKFVESTLNWSGFGEGLYWFLAHMDTWRSDARASAAAAEGYQDQTEEDVESDDDNDNVYQRPVMQSAWSRLIQERTPLTATERHEGAVDVDWFHRTFEVLGKKRWMQMAACAKLSANAAQAKRAQFVADALLGSTSIATLIEGIKKRNLKENVRLLGLVPLAKGAKRSKDVQRRYQVLLDYKKYARKLSSLAKPDALRALEIGMANLARTAGYSDSLRLEWALEAESIKDLAKGPVAITKEGVTVTLQLDEDAKPEMLICRGEKLLKTVPAKIRKKHNAIGELVDRAKELRKKSGRIKQSLEAAMCRGDVIDAAELVKLMQHAILAPNLKRLVLIGEGIAGYPDKGGKVLRDHRGKIEPIKKKESLRIAHCSDLFKLGDWDKWQAECFAAERVQPFKQVFRELYLSTRSENSKTQSSRFSGQQIGPKQGMALWGSRGWGTQDEVRKVFHDRSIIASVEFQYNYGTAAEIEGLTIEHVQFQDRESYKLIKLKEVPAKIFSEVMRDIDLVVSVAHRGEVDPEASESTVEMRTTLVRETCQLLDLKNVKFKKSHVIIKGHYSEYSIHLGSGGVHRLPGGYVAIIPVHAQHRGRLFLPFADNDPKTAEIVSKVLLLAKDAEILDPTILEQIGIAADHTGMPVVKAGGRRGQSKQKKKVKAVRRFELSDDKSNKFWEIKVAGKVVVTQWGKIGSNGRSTTKEFSNASTAKQAMAKMITEKVGKGYTEA